jgi:hypothetical protein
MILTLRPLITHRRVTGGECGGITLGAGEELR